MKKRKMMMTRLMGKKIREEGLRGVSRSLVAEGLVTEAEFRLAHSLKQTFYSPIRKRFAVIQPHYYNGQLEMVVAYLEPPRPDKEQLAPRRLSAKTKTVKAEYAAFWSAYVPPSPKRFN